VPLPHVELPAKLLVALLLVVDHVEGGPLGLVRRRVLAAGGEEGEEQSRDEAGRGARGEVHRERGSRSLGGVAARERGEQPDLVRVRVRVRVGVRVRVRVRARVGVRVRVRVRVRVVASSPTAGLKAPPLIGPRETAIASTVQPMARPKKELPLVPG